MPIFITMEDSETIGPDGFPIQRYTVHIEKPIYPDKNKSVKENADMMKEENARIWKEIYEETYSQPLTYDTKSPL